jgi:hypothetical protein
MVDVAELAAATGPYVTAVVSAYGRGVVDRLADESADAAADATLGLGRRLLRRLLASGRAPMIEAAVGDLAEEPADEDFRAALRGQVKKALAADQGLAVEVAGLLAAAGVRVVASGDRSIAAQTISGVASTGENATIER